jgi:cyclopropane-fatty-acyl-phospholipid synthase
MDVQTAQSASPQARPATAALIAGLRNVPASAKAIMFGCLRIQGGLLVIKLPDGEALSFGDGQGPHAVLEVRDMRFANRVLRSGDIGFAEGLMAGEWDTPDLSALLTLLAANADSISRFVSGGPIGKAIHTFYHLMRPNTRKGARKNILAHYDLGNRFYAAWLDPSMTYSSARFDAHTRDLEEGQRAKYRALADHLDLKPGEHVLEIGCGWGGFAEVAAKEYGARVTGLTISDEQLAYARERMEKAGLSHLVEIRRQDYRDVEGQFDKVASIEMFEAVGEKYWSAYFSKIAQVLKPGGRAALQIITIRDELFEAYRSRADFIQRHVFPGGMLASVGRLKEEVAKAGLVWRKLDAFGQNYADTLSEWGHRFQGSWEQIRTLGFDEQFKQLWRYYLAYCEAGFRTGRTDVVQLEISKA